MEPLTIPTIDQACIGTTHSTTGHITILGIGTATTIVHHSIGTGLGATMVIMATMVTGATLTTTMATTTITTTTVTTTTTASQ